MGRVNELEKIDARSSAGVVAREESRIDNKRDEDRDCVSRAAESLDKDFTDRWRLHLSGGEIFFPFTVLACFRQRDDENVKNLLKINFSNIFK